MFPPPLRPSAAAPAAAEVCLGIPLVIVLVVPSVRTPPFFRCEEEDDDLTLTLTFNLLDNQSEDDEIFLDEDADDFL